MQRTRDIRALQDTAARSRCFAHPRLALLVLDGKITCKKCNASLKIEPIPSETQKYMTGLTQSAAIHSKMVAKHGAWNMPTEKQVTDVAIIEPTQADIERVGKKFADVVEHFGATGEAELSRADLVLAAKLEMAGFQHFHFYVAQRKSNIDGRWHVTSSLEMNIKGRYFNAQRAMGPSYGGVTLEIISDEVVRKAAKVDPSEVLVQATLREKRADGTDFIRQQSFGRAGGPRDANQPVAKANPLEMAETRAEGRVLERGSPLGVDIGTYYGEVGTVIVSDGPSQVAALTEGDAGFSIEKVDTPEQLEKYIRRDDGSQPINDPVTVNEKTGEITTETVNRNNKANRQELMGLLKAADISKEQVEATGIDAIEMLRMGSEPGFIAELVSAKVNPPTKVEDGEDITELPW